MPRLSAVRPEAPASLDDLLARCLSRRPEERFDSAAELADALRGRGAPGKSLTLVVCQACGTGLRAGLRLCLHCGKAAVQFRHQAGSGIALDLVKLKEDAVYLAPLRETLVAVSEKPFRPLNFMIGDRRMFSREEREELIALPARLWIDLSEEGARRAGEAAGQRGRVGQARVDARREAHRAHRPRRPGGRDGGQHRPVRHVAPDPRAFCASRRFWSRSSCSCAAAARPSGVRC